MERDLNLEQKEYCLGVKPDFYVEREIDVDKDENNDDVHAKLYLPMFFDSKYDLLKFLIEESITDDREQIVRVAEKIADLFEVENLELDIIDEKEETFLMLDFINAFIKRLKALKKDYKYNLKHL